MERTRFPVYLIERDDFSGRLTRKLSFKRHNSECTHNRNSQGFVVSDTLDGGLAGHLTAPARCKLVSMGSGNLALEFPDGATLSAEDCYRAARSSDCIHSFGLGWSSAR
jgi:hypothetical protein